MFSLSIFSFISPTAESQESICQILRQICSGDVLYARPLYNPDDHPELDIAGLNRS
jgi:hypothetical protein